MANITGFLYISSQPLVREPLLPQLRLLRLGDPGHGDVGRGARGASRGAGRGAAGGADGGEVQPTS